VNFTKAVSEKTLQIQEVYEYTLPLWALKMPFSSHNPSLTQRDHKYFKSSMDAINFSKKITELSFPVLSLVFAFY
jgi:hypothetical protein